MSGATAGVCLSISEIKALLPHRYPMLLVDRVRDLIDGESAVGIKNVTINEPFFAGHFPGHPVMPGVLIIEAMAQTAAVLAGYGMTADGGDKVVYFMTIDGARFRQPVVPGDVLELHVRKTHSRRTVWKFQGEARVDGKLVSQAGFSAMIVDREE